MFSLLKKQKINLEYEQPKRLFNFIPIIITIFRFPGNLNLSQMSNRKGQQKEIKKFAEVQR